MSKAKCRNFKTTRLNIAELSADIRRWIKRITKGTFLGCRQVAAGGRAGYNLDTRPASGHGHGVPGISTGHFAGNISV
jgi:hypothetical protein